MSDIIIKRVYLNIGWSDKLSFYNIDKKVPIRLKCYNGVLCFQQEKRIGYNTWKKNAKQCNITLNNNCQF